ncbi:MAG TPA: type II secretion system protein [Candidatus Ozemobacteraceae bacterium]|nr:type II secretion system protein [Candidatus Ozemobacteraceae bacterium]
MRHQTRRAITLVEILIALGLLAFSMVVLITTFQGAGREMAFTAEHYSAMFLAQKVLEDVNQRLQENPHTFTELVQDATGQEVPVVGGASKYFRLLENTVRFDRLLPDEDQSIVAGPLFEQLKGFTVKVSTRLDHPLAAGQRNLLELEIVIGWKGQDGHQKEYRLSQLLQGTDDAVFAEPYSPTVPTPETQARLDRGALKALADMLAPMHPQLAAIPEDQLKVQAILQVCPSASQQAVMLFGQVLFLIDDCLSVVDRLNATIRPLEMERDQLQPLLTKVGKTSGDFAACLKFTDLQRRISSLYQQKGVGVVQRVLLLIPLLPQLKGMLMDPAASLGPRLSLYTPTLVGKLLMTNQAVDIVQLAFSSAEKCYLSLTVSPILESLPRRQEPEVLRRVLDLQKIVTLMLPGDGDAEKNCKGYQQNLRQFREKYLGHHPNFVAFLDRESERGRDLRTLRQNFTGLVQVFEVVRSLSDHVDDVVSSVPKAFR